MTASDTAAQLLDEAQGLIMARGYNAFSYKDLAAAVGIRTASIHYHFPTKGDLGVALMQRYVAGLDGALERIDRGSRSASAKIKAFVKLYAETESAGAICLCGSLASDIETLPPELQEVVHDYLARSEKWLAGVIAAGIDEGELRYAGRPADAAATLLSSLQGGLILSRARSARTSTLTTVQRVFLELLDAA